VFEKRVDYRPERVIVGVISGWIRRQFGRGWRFRWFGRGWRINVGPKMWLGGENLEQRGLRRSTWR